MVDNLDEQMVKEAKRWRFFRKYMFEEGYVFPFPRTPEDADRIIDEGIEQLEFEKKVN